MGAALLVLLIEQSWRIILQMHRGNGEARIVAHWPTAIIAYLFFLKVFARFIPNLTYLYSKLYYRNGLLLLVAASSTVTQTSQGSYAPLSCLLLGKGFTADVPQLFSANGINIPAVTSGILCCRRRLPSCKPVPYHFSVTHHALITMVNSWQGASVADGASKEEQTIHNGGYIRSVDQSISSSVDPRG